MKNKMYTRRLLVFVLGMSTVLSYALVKNSADLKITAKIYTFVNSNDNAFPPEPIYYNPDNLFGQYGDVPNKVDFAGFGVSSLELVSFNAIKSGNKVEIFWTAVSNFNNDYFTLERSRNGIDFNKVAVIDVTGIAKSTLQYWETDYQPLKGVSYYRLKHTDLNNKNSYSNIVMVNYVIDKNKGTRYSNTSTTSALKLNLINLENTEVLVVLRDMDGNEFYSKVVVSIEDSKIIGVDTQNKIAPGTYIVTATSNNALYSQKLTIKE